MKLRIRGHSVRLRLTRGEITELIDQGCVENRVQLGSNPENALAYRLELSDTIRQAQTRFEGSGLSVQLPVAEAKAWAQGQSIGIYAETKWGLKIAVEKDFKCLDQRRDEDETDAFENPHAGSHPACPANNE